MKIHIVFKIKNTPTGGGNQFLKALKKYFSDKGIYTDEPAEADVFLFNSYQFIPELIRLKKKYPHKLFVHRIDGPIRLYSRMADKRDNIINLTNKHIADATIFQSEWSRKANHELGLQANKHETTITNAPDSSVFYAKSQQELSGKIKLIATSWSSWHKKGFGIYKWLDDNLDFNKYEMTFCGNSPVTFKNIKHIPPLPSNELAKQLRSHDIFITASQKDPCSNSLIEALHCGLPAIALQDGGHPEIIKKGGETFTRKEEIFGILDKISAQYSSYAQNINVPAINEVAKQYQTFIEVLFSERTEESKSFNLLKSIRLHAAILNHKLSGRIRKYIPLSNGKK